MSRVSVGRQPIFDRSLGVLGYELLYRASSEDQSAADTGDRATAQVIVSTYTELGLERLVGDRLTFINVTRNFVTGAMPLPISSHRVVLELLPTVGADEEVLAGAAELRRRGFGLALDDYGVGDPRAVLLPHCDMVKVDITRTAPPDLQAIVAQVQAAGVRMAAMRVEGLDDMSRGLELGFDYFQGYHLVRPDVVTTKVITPSKAAVTELLTSLHSGTEGVDEVLRTDVALAYRLLRALGATPEEETRVISTLPQALQHLGAERLRMWLQLLLATEVDRPTEGQLSAALTRARSCELLAEAYPGVSPATAYLAGLVSTLDQVLECGTPEVVGQLPLAPMVVGAVLSGSGPLGMMLRAVAAQENDEEIQLTLGGEQVDPFQLSRIHLEAMAWSLQVCEQDGEQDAGLDADDNADVYY